MGRAPPQLPHLRALLFLLLAAGTTCVAGEGHVACLPACNVLRVVIAMMSIMEVSLRWPSPAKSLFRPAYFPYGFRAMGLGGFGFFASLGTQGFEGLRF